MAIPLSMGPYAGLFVEAAVLVFLFTSSTLFPLLRQVPPLGVLVILPPSGAVILLCPLMPA